MSHNIEVQGGSTVRLPTKGKYCDRDIVITATGGGGGDRTMENGLVGRTLTEYINDTADTIGTYAFAYYSSLEYVSMPNATTISGGNNFLSCSKLKRINIPNLKNVVSNAGNHFRNCTALEELRVPLLNTVLSVGRCTALKVYELATPYNISANAFANLTLLDTLVLHCTKVVPLANVNAFTGTPFSSGGTGGRVFVPQQYIEGFKTATNWSALYAIGNIEFVALEGSEYE